MPKKKTSRKSGPLPERREQTTGKSVWESNTFLNILIAVGSTIAAAGVHMEWSPGGIVLKPGLALILTLLCFFTAAAVITSIFLERAYIIPGIVQGLTITAVIFVYISEFPPLGVGIFITLFGTGIASFFTAMAAAHKRIFGK